MSTRGRSRSCGPWFSADRAGPCALRDRTSLESTRGSTTSSGRRFWTDRGMRKHSETSNLSKPDGMSTRGRSRSCGPWFSADRAGPCALRDRTLFESDRTRIIQKYPGYFPGTSVLITSTRGFEPPTYRLGGGRSIQLSYVDFFLLPRHALHSGHHDMISQKYPCNK